MGTLFSKNGRIPFNKTNVKVAVSTLASTATLDRDRLSSSPGYSVGLLGGMGSSTATSSESGYSVGNLNWTKRPTKKLYNSHSRMRTEPSQIYANLKNRQRNGSVQSGNSGGRVRKKPTRTFSNGLNGVYVVNH